LARHQEQAEKGEHPLNRIISIGEDAQGIVIDTTDIHLPRRIGKAAKRAFRGTLDEHCKSPSVAVPTSCLLRLWDSKQRGIGRSPCQLIWLNAKRNSSASTSNKTSVEEQRCSRWML
jgi:hypothetical protein